VWLVVLELERVKAAGIQEVARCGLGGLASTYTAATVHHVPIFLLSFFPPSFRLLFFSIIIIGILYCFLEHKTKRFSKWNNRRWEVVAGYLQVIGVVCG
jgi:hypothetical protein